MEKHNFVTIADLTKEKIRQRSFLSHQPVRD